MFFSQILTESLRANSNVSTFLHMNLAIQIYKHKPFYLLTCTCLLVHLIQALLLALLIQVHTILVVLFQTACSSITSAPPSVILLQICLMSFLSSQVTLSYYITFSSLLWVILLPKHSFCNGLFCYQSTRTYYLIIGLIYTF